jgi:prepilin signal peptidase PulO-like enzyme (type II secretory pathway)
MLLYGIAGFFFGTAIGSFLNVVVLRGEKREGINGRSRCPECKHKLGIRDLVPILSYLRLRGRCAYCNAKISPQYPLVELATGLSFAAIGVYLAGLPTNSALHIAAAALFLGTVASLLILIVVHDLRAKIIPDRFVYAFIAIGFLSLFFDLSSGYFTIPSLGSVLAGPVFFFPFFALWFFSRGKWIGLGDGKLALGIGWYLGLELGFSAIILAFWIGAFVSVAMLLYLRARAARSSAQTSSKSRLREHTQELTMKSEVPFAPFLVLGFVLVAVFELNVFALELFPTVL